MRPQFSAYLRDGGLPLDGGKKVGRPNLSAPAQRYLDGLGTGVEDLFHHALAVLHAPGLPGGQRRSSAHGVAPHPAAGVA